MSIVYLSNVRLSFPNIVKPQVKTNPETGTDRTAYNCELLMPPTHEGFKQFVQTYGQLALERWKEHAQNVMGMVNADRRYRCFGSGEEKVNKKTFKVYEGYAGNVYITCSRDNPPQIIDHTGAPVDPLNTMAYQALAGKMYAGCRVNAAVKPWLQDNKHGRGVRCELIALQFAGDDAPFGEGGTPDVSNIFGAVATPAGAAAAPAAMPLPPFMAAK